MSGALGRARAAANARADRMREHVRGVLAQALPGIRVETVDDRIVLSGRKLLRRWVRRPPLTDRQEFLR